MSRARKKTCKTRKQQKHTVMPWHLPPNYSNPNTNSSKFIKYRFPKHFINSTSKININHPFLLGLNVKKKSQQTTHLSSPVLSQSSAYQVTCLHCGGNTYCINQAEGMKLLQRLDVIFKMCQHVFKEYLFLHDVT